MDDNNPVIVKERLDDLHMTQEDLRSLSGYNKPFNFILSARECGKTTLCWLFLAYLSWERDARPYIYLTRSCVEITEALISSIFEVQINKWIDVPLVPIYNVSDFDKGIVDVYAMRNGERTLFVRIVSLSIKMRRIKLAVLRNCGGILMDEYVIDPRTDEKYVPNEAFKIKEAYTTWRRECPGTLKCWFLGNPYSLFNPLFMAWNVDAAKLIESKRKDSVYVGDTFLIKYANVNPELRAKLLSENPLYVFDEDYSKYALEGNAVNDANIPLRPKQPEGFSLRFVFLVQDRYLGVFRGDRYEEGSFPFWVGFLTEVGARRTAFCLELEDLVGRSALLGVEERMRLRSFKDAMRMRRVEFSDVSVYYLCEEIYKSI